MGHSGRSFLYIYGHVAMTTRTKSEKGFHFFVDYWYVNQADTDIQ